MIYNGHREFPPESAIKNDSVPILTINKGELCPFVLFHDEKDKPKQVLFKTFERICPGRNQAAVLLNLVQ